MRNIEVSKYFHPRKFIHNNIKFRIQSSESISLFKIQQAFILKQMYSNANFEFSIVSKDIMLLKYDIWYDWINEIEQLILCDMKNNILEIKSKIIKLARERKKYYEELLRENFKDRELEFINFWIDSHEKIYTLLEEKISNIDDNLDKGIFFSSIVNIISSILKRTLYEIQELETIFFQDIDVNICIDNIYIEIFKKDPTIFEEKIKDFMKIKKFNKIIIKNYSDIDNLEVACTRVLNLLKENNIKYYII